MKKKQKQLAVKSISTYTGRPLSEMSAEELKERSTACEIKAFATIGYYPVASS